MFQQQEELSPLSSTKDSFMIEQKIARDSLTDHGCQSLPHFYLVLNRIILWPLVFYRGDYKREGVSKDRKGTWPQIFSTNQTVNRFGALSGECLKYESKRERGKDAFLKKELCCRFSFLFNNIHDSPLLKVYQSLLS